MKIGASGYRKLIGDNAYFVDKTLFIKEAIDSAHEVMLIPPIFIIPGRSSTSSNGIRKALSHTG